MAKQYAYWILVNYREAYNMFAVNGILFNHESPRRGPTFVTRKITMAVARIAKGLQECLYLGNLDSQRDWGHAKEYVYAMWLMLQADKPDDYVVATGETHTVRKFVEKAFSVIDRKITCQCTRQPTRRTTMRSNSAPMIIHLSDDAFGTTLTNPIWPPCVVCLLSCVLAGEGSAEEEVGKDQDGKILIRVDPKYYRPTEVELLLGDPTKIKRALGWECKIKFEELAKEMVEEDLKSVGDKTLKW